MGDRKELKIPLAEERLVLGKEVAETGRVRISSRVEEEEVPVEETLVREKVRVERVAVDEVQAEPPRIREEGDRLVVPVFEEVLVKRFHVTEELHVSREQTEEPFSGSVPLRRTKVEVERD